MKRMVGILYLCCGLMLLSACGGAPAGATLDNQTVGENFATALLAGKFDEAKALAVADNKAKVSSAVDTFAPLLEKYEFREIKVNSTRAWDFAGNPEGDKRGEITYQFREKGEENRWKIGTFSVRILSSGGLWGIADLVLDRPKE